MTKSKWQSRRWILCVWAVLMASYLMLSGSSYEWSGMAITMLLGIIGGYIAADSLTKPKGVYNGV